MVTGLRREVLSGVLWTSERSSYVCVAGRNEGTSSKPRPLSAHLDLGLEYRGRSVGDARRVSVPDSARDQGVADGDHDERNRVARQEYGAQEVCLLVHLGRPLLFAHLKAGGHGTMDDSSVPQKIGITLKRS